MKALAVIPARGGSKEIPRKNLRPLNGFPLIYYSILACLNARSIEMVVVSTDDDEIALISDRFGATALARPASLAGDDVTLDPVIAFTVAMVEAETGLNFDMVVTVQPTSPLLLAADVDAAVARLANGMLDTVLTVVEDRHLTWRIDDGQAVPNYSSRLNRQQIAPVFRETGAVVACRRELLHGGTRFGPRVSLLSIPRSRSIDVDSVEDLFVCEAILTSRLIVITVIGAPMTGLGHVYRALTLANSLVRCSIVFVCEETEFLAIEKIKASNYPLEVCLLGTLESTISGLSPNLVINDILDTSAEYVKSLKDIGIRVVNFEDLGDGASLADLTINALYPSVDPRENLLCGPDFFCLRDEFIYIRKREFAQDVSRVLLTFGGVDEGNLTCRVLRELLHVVHSSVCIDIVVGAGFCHGDELKAIAGEQGPLNVSIVHNTSRISEYMNGCDFAVTSGGRTVLELASLEKPMIVICQNEREATHSFARADNGIINLGVHSEVSDQRIRDSLKLLLDDKELRLSCKNRLGEQDLTGGKFRIVEAIEALMERCTTRVHAR